jgi:hypothetical protein
LFEDVDAFVTIEDEVDCLRHIDALYFEHRIIFVDQLVLLVVKEQQEVEVEWLYEALEEEGVVLLNHDIVQMDKQQPVVEAVVFVVVLTLM